MANSAGASSISVAGRTDPSNYLVFVANKRQFVYDRLPSEKLPNCMNSTDNAAEY
jgi:hypothetical protein